MAQFTLPLYAAEVINNVCDQRITCPRCDKQFVVDKEWPGPYGYKARMCPYCSKASAVPSDAAILYDGHTTLRVTMGEAQALVAVEKVAYSEQDGPHGIVFRPVDGLTVEQVKKGLARFA